MQILMFLGLLSLIGAIPSVSAQTVAAQPDSIVNWQPRDVIQLVSLLGTFAALVTLIWRYFDTRKAFLHINLTTSNTSNSKIKLRTEVKNINSIPRKLDGAFLVIGPVTDKPKETIERLLPTIGEDRAINSLNKIVRAVTEKVRQSQTILMDDNGRMLIPLPYYFKENYDVADEELSYEAIIDPNDFPAGIYSARFYIEGIPRLHRVVHASFDIAG